MTRTDLFLYEVKAYSVLIYSMLNEYYKQYYVSY